MKSLENALETYVENTKDLITAIEKGDYGNLKYLADKREVTLDIIKSLNSTSDELREIFTKLEVEKYHKILD